MTSRPVGQANRMTENTDDVPTTGGITGPQDPTHEATTPPGNADVDQESVDKGQDKLDHVEAGH
jgi:hypothetical protein